MEQQPSKYDYLFVGGERNSYTFLTDLLIGYEIQFKPTPYLFGDAFPAANEIVELVIKVADNPTGRRPPLDKLVPPTIAAIVNDFYRKSSLAITIFICDTHDLRHAARWRKFNSWYVHFTEMSPFHRVDDSLWDEANDVFVRCAVLVKLDNPYIKEISLAFIDLMNDYRGK